MRFTKIFIFLFALSFVSGASVNNSFSQVTGAASSAADVKPIAVGEKIPDVTLKNAKGEPVSLTTLAGEKQTILVFFRGGWCPYCNKQLMGLQKIESDLTALGYQIVAITADKPEKISETVTNDELKYTILSDNNSDASIAFGIAFKVDDATVEKYKGYNLDLDEASGNSNHILPVPSVFILDKQGKIKYEYVNPDYKVRLDENKLLEEAKNNKQ
ncbi:MAG: AhpC/TSA family protein [Ignavibacteria bacterium]|nr:AhpC/TSA family protein [Ignavibacteria bacterium]